jgi:hypothetical protein
VHPNLPGNQLSVSQFDISSLLKPVHYLGPKPEFFDLSNRKLGSIISDHVRPEAFNNSQFADTRDIDFLRARFFQEY